MAINADGSIHTEGAVAADPFMNLLFQAAMGLTEKKEEEDKGEVTKEKVVTGAGAASSSSGSSQPQGSVAMTQEKTETKDETSGSKRKMKNPRRTSTLRSELSFFFNKSSLDPIFQSEHVRVHRILR